MSESNCQFFGIHGDERPAVVFAGWLCEIGHLRKLKYCEECWDYVEGRRMEDEIVVRCSPLGRHGDEICWSETKMLEVVRV